MRNDSYELCEISEEIELYDDVLLGLSSDVLLKLVDWLKIIRGVKN